LSPGFGTEPGHSRRRRDQPTLLPEHNDSIPAEAPWGRSEPGQYSDQDSEDRYDRSQYASGRPSGGQYANSGQYTDGDSWYDNAGRYNDSQFNNSQYDNRQYDNGQFPPDRHDAAAFHPGQNAAGGPSGQRQVPRRQLRRPAQRSRVGLRIAKVFGVGVLATALIVAVLAFLFPGTLPETSTASTSPIGLQGSGPAAGLPAKVDPSAPADSLRTEPESQALPSEIPDLGPRTLAKIPADSRQVVVATGRGKNSSYAEVALHQRTSDGWRAGATWPARNGRKGWSAKHREDDLRSPIGVFALTDTGGLLRDVGGKLPYYRSDLFKINRLGMLGQSLAGSYDYVIAINYNRRPGHPPLDKVRPLGQSKGGGIWLHVRSDGPTQACISLTRAQMRTLVKTLDPDKKPVIVMGDRASISK
jgi:L,D-peptidoglycan transpeptidase YkuD (ErfK/YbiS/YcfS/YnhG family)